MDLLRRSTFGQLFTTAFVVTGSFQGAAALLGVLTAVLSPGLFNMNGAPATNPGQALGVVLFMTALFVSLNAGMSALGALIWLAVRGVVPSAKAAPSAEAR